MLQSKVRGRYCSSVCVQEHTCIRAGFLSICLDGEQRECVCVHASKRVCIIYHPRNVFSPLSICIYLQLLSEVATQEVKPTARFTFKPVRRTNCVSESVPTCSDRHRLGTRHSSNASPLRVKTEPKRVRLSGCSGKSWGLESRLGVRDTNVRSARSSCTLNCY